MLSKHKVVNKNLVQSTNKVSNWDELIAMAERSLLWAKVQQEELAAAIKIYRQKRDAGEPWPGARVQKLDGRGQVNG